MQGMRPLFASSFLVHWAWMSNQNQVFVFLSHDCCEQKRAGAHSHAILHF